MLLLLLLLLAAALSIALTTYWCYSIDAAQTTFVDRETWRSRLGEVLTSSGFSDCIFTAFDTTKDNRVRWL